MKPLLIAALSLALASPALAQTPPSKEQMQMAMMRQMQMMAAMFDFRRSKLGFDETVEALKKSSQSRGWPAGQVYDMQQAMQQAGAMDAKRVRVLAACPPEANARLAKASPQKLPPLPCRYTVFEGRDGKTYLIRMNTHMLEKTLKGEPAKVMASIAAEEDAMLKDILE